MIEVSEGLFVGSQVDYEAMKHDCNDWGIVQACKEPYHRDAVGYRGRATSKDHPEYLWAHRGNRLILNLIDVADPGFVAHSLIMEALRFIGEHRSDGRKVLVHCNQGHSRSPSIAMMYMARSLDPDFEEAQHQFRQVYPEYTPAEGIRLFALARWPALHEGMFAS